MSTASVVEAVETVERAATKPDTTVRNGRALKIGEYIRQGDVYILRVDGRALNKQAKVEVTDRNLAAGGGNVVRHQAVGDKIKVYQTLLSADKLKVLAKETVDGQEVEALKPLLSLLPSATPLLGPTVVSEEDWTLEHVEHAHCQLPAGTFQVIWQMDERSKQRVAD